MRLLCTLAVITIGLFPQYLQAGVVSLSSAEDTYVRGGSFGNTVHSGGDLLLKNDASLSYTRKSWIQFDTSSLGAPVLDASLKLTHRSSGTFDMIVNVFGLHDLAAGELWDESTLTWNNAPGNDTSSKTGVTGDATLLGTLTVSGSAVAGEVLSFSAASLTNFLNADTNGRVTFILSAETPSSAHGITFASLETPSSAGPTLDINAVPEPGSLALLGMGLAGLCCYRGPRRKQTPAN